MSLNDCGGLIMFHAFSFIVMLIWLIIVKIYNNALLNDFEGMRMLFYAKM